LGLIAQVVFLLERGHTQRQVTDATDQPIDAAATGGGGGGGGG